MSVVPKRCQVGCSVLTDAEVPCTICRVTVHYRMNKWGESLALISCHKDFEMSVGTQYRAGCSYTCV